MLADENESQTSVPVQVPTAEAENVANVSEPTESSGEGYNQPAVASKVPTKEEIKLLQARIKAIGFDPGPLDGMFGLKTRSALTRLQSSCANLKDLVENSDAGVFQPPVTQTARPNASADKLSNNEEVRLLQMRLRDSGFYAGPIDGVHGHKTQAALVRLQAGCTLLKGLPDVNFQTAARPPSRSVAVTKNESDRVIALDSQGPSKQELQIVQSRLKDAGFDPGPIDGVLGPRTKSALQQFRSSYGPVNLRKLSSGTDLKLDY